LRDLRSALVVPDEGGGRVTVQDILDMGTAVGEADTDLAHRVARNEAVLRAACAQPVSAVAVWLAAPRRALEALDALGARLATRAPSAHVPDLAPLRDLLRTIAEAIDAARAGARADTPDPQRAPESSQAPDPGFRLARPVHCREDATRAIEAVCAYLERAEPASPAPLLLRRAQRLMHMSFLDAVADLAPGGLEQLRTVAGIGDGR
jgi:type VI secretion system protein ImpA